MSRFYRENGDRYVPVYDDGRTKQSFKDECDINKLLKKAAVKGGLAHIQKYPEATYGEFDPAMDLFVARERIAKAEEIFMDLPAEVRREFNNDAVAFIQHGQNVGLEKLIEEIPQIAEPGNYFPNPAQRGGQGAGAATAPADPAAAPEPPAEAPPPAPSPEEAP
jgi:hypothetical protein